MNVRDEIEEAQEKGAVTLEDLRRWVSAAKGETEFCPRTNETYYPAAWSYGEGAGDASTSTPYDHRLSLAANHVASLLGVDVEFELNEVTRGRDAASVIYAALRAQRDADALEDTHAEAAVRVAPLGGVRG